MASLVQIQLRRDTSANWSSNNPTLAAGEPGFDTTNNLIKIGNGSSNWNALEYQPANDKLDQFNATNGQTIFNLATTPSIISKALVFVNGAQQELTADYTISAATITWLDTDFVLSNSDKVTVYYK